MFRLSRALIVLLATAPEASDIAQQVKRFTSVYALIEQNAADPLSSERAFYQGAIPGMLRRLDPHSVFFDPEQFQQLKQLETSTRKGFGSVVSVLPGRVIVLQALPGTPSARSGIAPGDEILAINGYELARLDLDQLVSLLSQSRQQQARLDVKRPGNARILQFVLAPEEMQAPSVERAFLLKPGVGYLRVSSFDEKTGTHVKAAIDKLGGAKLQGLVLDLRGNPGGLLGSALETASLFLKPGLQLLTIRGRSVPLKEEQVPQGSKPYAFPLAVLINGSSASGAEIVAGALQDHDRAVIVGEPSFGKGLVESVFPLAESTGLALTTAMYYTPSGRSIQRPLDSSQFALATAAARSGAHKEFRTDSGRKVMGGGGIQPDHLVHPPGMSRLHVALEASGSFTSFATEYTQRHPGITENFEVSPDLLDEFHVYLAERNIQPTVSDWSRQREFIRNRLKAEIFNQALGVAKGDEVEAQRDPQILKALEMISGPTEP